MTANIIDHEEEILKERIEGMTVEEQQIAVKFFPIEVVFNELERRECERIALLGMLDDVSHFLEGMAR